MRTSLTFLASTVLTLQFACSNNYEKDESPFDSLADNNDDNEDEDEDEDDQNTDTSTETQAGDADIDDDGDGFSENQGDCNDNNDQIHPNATEVCNNADDDCNGTADDNPVNGNTYYQDSDGDGYGNGAATISACDTPPGYVTNSDDCDDSSNTAKPGGNENDWNGIDEDCDGYDVDLEECVALAIQDTSQDMEGIWYPDDYSGTYKDPAIGVFDLADWMIANQILALRSGTTSSTQNSFEEYEATFDAYLSLNDEFNGFYVDISTSSLAENVLGLDYDIYCDGWVTETPASFNAEMSLSVIESTKAVNAVVSVAPFRSSIGQSDVNLVSWPDGGICETQILDLMLDYAASQGQGWAGDTLGILDDSFETTSQQISAQYETILANNIASRCSQ